jgi:hypothetical protein
VWGIVERLLRAALPKGWESTRNHRYGILLREVEAGGWDGF